MPRFSYLLWASCLGSVAVVLSACTPATSSNSRAAAASAQAQLYDDYYGQPSSQTRSARINADRPAARGNSARTRIEINPTAPQTYTVQKGDTLWGIARKFLKTPWYWPELWDKNRGIANPHRIRPGDVLHFSASGDGAPRNSVSAASAPAPRIHIEQRGSGDTISTLSTFLKWPRIATDDEIRSAPYILASRDGHSLVAPGETVYIKNLRGVNKGQRLAVYHPDKPIYDPDTGALLGHQLTYSGYLRLERMDSVSTAVILEAEGAIREGDRLFPVDGRHEEMREPIQIPAQKIRGRIAALYDAEYMGANCMIIAINRGRQQGMKAGYTVGIYTDGRKVEDKYRPYAGNSKVIPVETLPPEKVANAIIYSVHNNMSYGLIIDSEREVKNGDRIGNP